MGFSRQEYWSGLSFPSPGDIADLGLPHCPYKPQFIHGKQTEDNLSSVISCDHIYYANGWEETPRL